MLVAKWLILKTKACYINGGTQYRLTLLCAMMIFCAPTAWADSVRQPTIAIIIDDMGNHMRTGRQLINLPYPLTLAFLPHRKHTKELAQYAHDVNKEVMLHIPMSNTLGLNLGAGGLTMGMTELEMTVTLRRALRSIPHVQGVNNHMGSALTQRRKEMHWVMKELYNYPLYFVDSRTIAGSVAGNVAQLNDIPNLTRDVFLDHTQVRKDIHKQFLRLINIAKAKGTAVAIGHPHQVTADYLSWALPRLDKEGVRISTVSAMWAIRNNGGDMFAARKRAGITLADNNEILQNAEPSQTLDHIQRSKSKL